MVGRRCRDHVEERTGTSSNLSSRGHVRGGRAQGCENGLGRDREGAFLLCAATLGASEAQAGVLSSPGTETAARVLGHSV